MKDLIKYLILVGLGAYGGFRYSVFIFSYGLQHPDEFKDKKIDTFIEKVYKSNPAYYEKLFLDILVDHALTKKQKEEIDKIVNDLFKKGGDDGIS